MYIVLFYILGILFGHFFVYNNIILAALFSAVAFIISLKNKKALLPLFISLIFILGFFNYNFREGIKLSGTHSVDGRVVKVDERGFVLKYRSQPFVYSKAFVKSEDAPTLGSVVRVRGNFTEPNGGMNFGAFSYKNYLMGQNILNEVRDPHVKIIKGPNFFYNRANTFNKKITSTFAYGLSEKNAKVMTSIILGNSKLMGEDVNIYRSVGIAHILAVSGFHIGLIYLGLISLFSFFELNKNIGRIIGLIVALVYTFLIGAPAGALRICFMILFANIAYFSKTKYRDKDGILAAAFITLLVNPLAIFNVSFILSYAGAGAIIYFYPILKRRYSGGKLFNTFIMVLAINLIIFPIQSRFFNDYNLLSIVANIILVPLYSVAIILGYILTVLTIVGIKLKLLFVPLDLILKLCNLVLNIFNDFLLFKITVPKVSVVSTIFYYIGILLIFGGIRLNKRYNVFYKLCALFLIFAMGINIYGYAVERNKVHMSFLYVGQGDGCLITSRDKAYMVDTGGSRSEDYRPGKIYLLPVLKSRGIDKLDGIFISHYDTDHMGAIEDIWDDIKISAAFTNTSPTDKEFVNKMLKHKIKVYGLETGDGVDTPLGSFKVLYDGVGGNSENNCSTVLMFNTFGKKILFTGDGEEDIEKYYWDERADILKVSHHGSRTGTGDEFLDRVDPKFAVISCGINNTYGHPHEEVLNRLYNRNIKTFITKDRGEVRFTIGKDNLTVETKIPDEKINLFEYRDDVLAALILTLAGMYLVLNYRWKDEL